MTNSDERTDALIDDVAGRMTEGAPAADFTARVLQRIDARQPRLRWRWVWVAAPLAATAVFLIAMQVVRLKAPLDVTRGGPERVEGPDTTGAKPDAAEKTPTAVDAPSMVRLTPDATDTRPRVTRPTRDVAEDRTASTIDALAPPRLDVARLDVTPLEASVASADSIEVDHLETIAPIAVTPLGTDIRQ